MSVSRYVQCLHVFQWRDSKFCPLFLVEALGPHMKRFSLPRKSTTDTDASALHAIYQVSIYNLIAQTRSHSLTRESRTVPPSFVPTHALSHNTNPSSTLSPARTHRPRVLQDYQSSRNTTARHNSIKDSKVARAGGGATHTTRLWG